MHAAVHMCLHGVHRRLAFECIQATTATCNPAYILCMHTQDVCSLRCMGKLLKETLIIALPPQAGPGGHLQAGTARPQNGSTAAFWAHAPAGVPELLHQFVLAHACKQNVATSAVGGQRSQPGMCVEGSGCAIEDLQLGTSLASFPFVAPAICWHPSQAYKNVFFRQPTSPPLCACR